MSEKEHWPDFKALFPEKDWWEDWPEKKTLRLRVTHFLSLIGGAVKFCLRMVGKINIPILTPVRNWLAYRKTDAYLWRKIEKRRRRRRMWWHIIDAVDNQWHRLMGWLQIGWRVAGGFPWRVFAKSSLFTLGVILVVSDFTAMYLKYGLVWLVRLGTPLVVIVAAYFGLRALRSLWPKQVRHRIRLLFLRTRTWLRTHNPFARKAKKQPGMALVLVRKQERRKIVEESGDKWYWRALGPISVFLLSFSAFIAFIDYVFIPWIHNRQSRMASKTPGTSTVDWVTIGKWSLWILGGILVLWIGRALTRRLSSSEKKWKFPLFPLLGWGLAAYAIYYVYKTQFMEPGAERAANVAYGLASVGKAAFIQPADSNFIDTTFFVRYSDKEQSGPVIIRDTELYTVSAWRSHPTATYVSYTKTGVTDPYVRIDTITPSTRYIQAPVAWMSFKNLAKGADSVKIVIYKHDLQGRRVTKTKTPSA